MKCMHGISRIDCDLCDCEKYLAEAGAKISKLETALKNIVAVFSDENESGDSDTFLKILRIAEDGLS